MNSNRMIKIVGHPQVIYLFLSNFAILFIGMGLFPVLPLYAARFGASDAMIGLYLALTYISISTGSILTSTLSGRVDAKKMYMAAGISGIPSLVLLGQATALWQVFVLTGLIWFAGGIGLSLANVFMGIYTRGTNRGRSFGIQSMAMPLGAILGGMTVGRLVSTAGYPVMFITLAVVWSLWPAMGLLKVQYPSIAKRASASQKALRAAEKPCSNLTPLALAVLFSALAISVGRLGISLTMKAQQFDAAAISSTSVIGGLAAIPAVFLIGSLSDRLGRKQVLTMAYGMSAGAALILSLAGSLWQFWMASILLLIAMATNDAMSAALVSDVLPKDILSRRLPQITTLKWVAGVAGFAASGWVVEMFGPSVLLGITAVMPVGAIVMLGRLSTPKESTPVPAPCFTPEREPTTVH